MSDYSELYDAHYYAHGCGRPYQRDEEWLRFFDSVAERIVSDIQPNTVLDAGCAMGFLVECLRRRDVAAFGVDVSEYAIQNAHSDIQPYCWVNSITGPFPQRYDLIVSIEVLEHMPQQEAELAIKNMCTHSDDILFSSTPLDYKEPTHFNVQPLEYWAEIFARQGFFRDVDFDASFITHWAVRFRKIEEPVSRLVRLYERRMWYLLQDNHARRELNVEQRNELAQQEKTVQILTAQAKEMRVRAEKMRVRAKDAERMAQLLQTQARAWQELQTTMGWVVLQSLQRLRAKVMPPGSHREELLVSMLGLFRSLKQEGVRALLRRRLGKRRRRVSGSEAAHLYAFHASRGDFQSTTRVSVDSLRLALYTTDTWTSACGVLRLIGPARYSYSGVKVLRGVSWEHGPSLILPDEADAVVIQRDFPRHQALYQQVVDWARSEDKPIVYELDDLLLELPNEHPEKAYFDKVQDLMRQALVHADAAIVSTLGLAEYVRALNPNTWLLPNYLDDEIWTLRSKSRGRKTGPVVVGYMGGMTKTHLPDLEIVTPILQRLLENYGDRIQLRFLGTVPSELEGLPRVEFAKEIFPDYRAFARYFSKQNIDIFIAPLRNNLFNRCKSWIKFLEYSALGAPGVYSRIAPYEGIVVHGKNGFLASSPQEWEAYLGILIKDHILRRSMGNAAQDTVKRMLLSDHAHEWGTVYRAALAAIENID